MQEVGAGVVPTGPAQPTMMRSPGAALSMAFWIALFVVFGPGTKVGVFPPTVTVMASMDCLPLAALTTSSPHFGPLGCATLHKGTVGGTVQVIWRSPPLQVAATPPMVTVAPVPKP